MLGLVVQKGVHVYQLKKNCNFVIRNYFKGLCEDLVLAGSCVKLLNLNVIALSVYAIPKYNVKSSFFAKLE